MHPLHINGEGDKESMYQSVLPQIEALIEPGIPAISNISNLVAVLKQTFRWWWVGFYVVHNKELMLGPFQGPVACTRIARGKGVCGMSWEKKETIVVPDVNQFAGHIACSSESLSEIVVPIIIQDIVVAVLDVDSEHLNHFDETDQKYLEQMVNQCSHLFVDLPLR